MRIAFIVEEFPATTQTFVIDQVADLMDAGIAVEVFALTRGNASGVAGRYFSYDMQRFTHYLDVPQGMRMWVVALMRLLLLLRHDRSLLRLFRKTATRPKASRAQLLFMLTPFVGRKFDLYHCHFGPVAREYLLVKRLLGHTEPMVTTFYGYDVSAVLNSAGSTYYDELRRECSLFFVMSSNMKERVVAAGFDAQKVVVHPVSIRVGSFPFAERRWEPGQPLRIASVGRFIEKKGFDDVIRAIELVRARTSFPLEVDLVGGGPLEGELRRMVAERQLEGVVRFTGYLTLEKIVDLLTTCHLFVQPSKTAANGDME